MLHKPPGPDELKREGVLFWRNPAGEWQGNRGGGGVAAIKRHLQSYTDLVIRLEQAYDQATSTTELFSLIEELTPLVRAARNMHLAFQSARDAAKSDVALLEMRDQAYEIERGLDLLLEDVRNALQYRMARDAEEQSRLSAEALQASHRLNILAALFFPLTAITSIFGMNLQHGLDDHNTILFWVVFAVGVALGLGMKAWVLAKSTGAGPGAAPRRPATRGD